MRIVSLSISEFGGLRDFSLELSDGLNIIKGDNESGKSTISLFIIYMLYGLPSSRKNTPSEHDKERALSWGSLSAKGSMIIEDGGRKYRIERENKKRSSGSVATVTDIDTGALVYTGDTPGMELLGVSRDTFASCLWCGQTRATAIDGKSIAEALSNLSLTADESVDGQNVLNTIKNQRKKYKYDRGNGGLISEAETQLDVLYAKKSEISLKIENGESDKRRLEQIKQELMVAEADFVAIDKKRKTLPKLKILKRFDKLDESKAFLHKEKSSLEALKKESAFGENDPTRDDLARFRNVLHNVESNRVQYNTLMSERSREESAVDMTAVRIAEKIERTEGRKSFADRIQKELSRFGRRMSVGAALCAAVVILGALGAIFLENIALAIIFFSLCAVTATLSTVSLLNAVKRRNSIRSELEAMGTNERSFARFLGYCFEQRERFGANEALRNKREAELITAKNQIATSEDSAEKILKAYGRWGESACEERLSALIFDIDRYIAKKEELERNITRLADRITEETNELSLYDRADILAEVEGIESLDISCDDREIEIKYELERARKETLFKQSAELEARLSGIEKLNDELADAEKDIELLEEKKREYERRYAVLDKAYAAVDAAYTEMRRDFAPKIRARAGEKLNAISDGRYSEIFLSEDMEIKVDVSGMARPSGALSTGTADALYIALRLSLAEHIFDSAVPFFMDETFAHLDDSRACGLLKLIGQYVAEDKQCVIFTCHKREMKLCDGLGMSYKLLEI